MRRRAGVLFFVLVFLSWPSLVSADVIGMAQITLQGVVPPLRCVIINDRDQIVEVTSNTTADIQPTVFRNKILTTNEVSLSPQVAKEYKLLSQEVNMRQVGVVYKYSSPTVTSKKSQPVFLSILTWHNYDFLMSAIINHKFIM